MPKIKIYEAMNGPYVDFYYAFGSYSEQEFSEALLARHGRKCNPGETERVIYLRKRVTKISIYNTEEVL